MSTSYQSHCLPKSAAPSGELEFAEETFAKIEADPAFDALSRAHWAEMVLNKDVRPYGPEKTLYARANELGVLKCYAARAAGLLAGYASYMVKAHMHHGPGCIVAINDLWYLTPEHRKGWAALRFLAANELQLRRLGVVLVYHHDAVTRARGLVLQRAGYQLVQLTYAKALGPIPDFEVACNIPSPE